MGKPAFACQGQWGPLEGETLAVVFPSQEKEEAPAMLSIVTVTPYCESTVFVAVYLQ